MPSITSPFSNTSFNPSSSSFPFHITMDLQSNSMKSLNQTTFTSLRNLASFPLPTPSSLFLVPFLPSLMDLSYTQLTSLPPGIFYNNINLVNLSILISFHSSSHSHSLHYLNSNRLASLPNGVFSQLTSLTSLPSSLPSILISLPHRLVISTLIPSHTLIWEIPLHHTCLYQSSLPTSSSISLW